MRAQRVAAIFVASLAGAVWAFDARAEQPYGESWDEGAWREPDFSRRHATPYGGRGGAGYGDIAGGGYGGRHRFHHGRPRHHPRGSYNEGWFQRPYPYHLDYYRMRYGGSYEPYFGNLYGPPIYVFPDRGFYGGYYYY